MGNHDGSIEWIEMLQFIVWMKIVSVLWVLEMIWLLWPLRRDVGDRGRYQEIGVSRGLISESAEKQQMTPKEILESCEDVIIPTLTVTGSLLQQVWKQGFVPRQLDSEDPSFICYVSRCRRRLLLAFIQKLLSLNSPDDVTHVICCVDAYYLVFKNYAAPNRERWKKYKSRVTATEMNLFVNCIKLDIKEKPDYERIRSSIEQLSNRY